MTDPSIDAGRRRLLRRIGAAAGALVLAGCDRLSNTEWLPKVLSAGERLSPILSRKIAGYGTLADQFCRRILKQRIRSNGTFKPMSAAYDALVAGKFADYALVVDGLVDRPQRYSLDALRALPSRTQITRHDCVEGWSAIGKWKGVPLAKLLEAAEPTTQARFVVFHCADPMEDDGTSLYYESVDMDDALHPQTILAYDLNDKPLPVENGAPLRLRVERQLGYKHAKYVMRIELVDSFAKIAGGNGGYWEDQGYQWYAGI